MQDILRTLVVLLTTLALITTTQLWTSSAHIELNKHRNDNTFGKQRLSFERNEGQADSRVDFISRGPTQVIFITPTEAVVRLLKTSPKKGRRELATLRMQLIGSSDAAQPSGEQSLPGEVNYLVGERTRWHTDISRFARVRYENVYRGIDIAYYGTSQNQLEYDFILSPGADPKTIAMRFDGAANVSLSQSGDLLLETNAGLMTQPLPVIYQETSNGRKLIDGGYVIHDDKKVTFNTGPYDASQTLIIDPQLIYSTYVGASQLDRVNGVAVNSAGEVFVAGTTFSPDFPVRNDIPDQDVVAQRGFITKLRADGTDIIYSTLFGDGETGCPRPVCGTEINGLALTPDGRAVFTGTVENGENNSDLPVSSNAYQKSGFCVGLCGLGEDRSDDAFATSLNQQGNDIVYSTFFGGGSSVNFGNRANDLGLAVAVDSGNRIYIAGRTNSSNLPTKHAFQPIRRGDEDAFVAVFDPAQTLGNNTLLYASYLGGTDDDEARSIAVDAARNVYIGGSTSSTDLSTKAPSGQSLPPLQSTFQGGSTDAFIAKIDSEETGTASLAYLTYFGGNATDRINGIAVDSAQRAYVVGATSSAASTFPLLNAFDSTQQNGESFVAKLNADGTARFYCSFLGGNNGNGPADFEEGFGITLDTGGNAYIAGQTTSAQTFPVGEVAPAFLANLQGTAFIAKVGPSVSTTVAPKLLVSTTFGGVGTRALALALDRKGNLYFGGLSSGQLPTTAGSFDVNFNGGTADGFIAKITSTFNDTIGVFRGSANQFLLRNSNTAGPPNVTIGLGQAGDQPVSGDWTGDGIDDVGVFRPSTGQFLLRQPVVTVVRPCPGCLPEVVTTITTIVVNFGQVGDLAVVGDWNGDGIDTPGVFRLSTAEWFLADGTNANNSNPGAAFIFTFGQAGDLPISADSNGDGSDGIGVFRASTGQFFLNDAKIANVASATFNFGQAGDLAVGGDWNGDGVDSVAVFRPSTGEFFLNDTNTSNSTAAVFVFGQNGDIPLSGDWDGKP